MSNNRKLDIEMKQSINKLVDLIGKVSLPLSRVRMTIFHLLVQRHLEYERFFQIVHGNSNYDIGRELEILSVDIEAKHPDALKSFGDGVSYQREWGDHKFDLMEILHLIIGPEFGSLKGADFATSNIDQIFEELLRLDDKQAGESFTASSVIKTMVALIAPKQGESLYDPVAGSGSLLKLAALNIGEKDVKIRGQEINQEVALLARIQLFLSGFSDVFIAQGNVLTNPAFTSSHGVEKFDIVLANPPFSISNDSPDINQNDPWNRFFWGEVPKRSLDFGFLQHVVSSIKEETGRAAILMSTSSLSREGLESEIRKNLILDNLIEAVIQLPPNLMYGTAISVALILFRKGRKGKDILFVNASEEYQSGRGLNTLSEKNIEKIISAVREKNNVKGFSQNVTIENLASREFDLSVFKIIPNVKNEKEERGREDLEAEIVLLEAKIARFGLEMKKIIDNE